MKLLIRQLLYRPRHAKPSRDPLSALLLPSLLGIVLCAVCLAGGTYAWFTAATVTPAQTIQSANYAIKEATLVAVPPESAAAEEAASDAGTPLSLTLGTPISVAPGQYILHITAEGTGTGYLKIQLGDTTLYTQQIKGGQTMAFALQLSQDATVTACWGTYAGYLQPDILAIGNQEP